MREYTTLELYRLSRSELLSLEHRMAITAIQAATFAPERTLAELNLHRIRRELHRREWALER